MPKVDALVRPALPDDPSREMSFQDRYGIPIAQYFPLDISKYSTLCNVYELLNCIIPGVVMPAADIFVFSIFSALWAQYEVLYTMFADLDGTSRHFDIRKQVAPVRSYKISPFIKLVTF